MRPRFRLPGILPAVVAACCVLAPPAHSAKTVEPGTKVPSPLKNFEVSAPEFCLGTHLEKESRKDRGSIVFLSDVGQLNRIDFIRLDQAEAGIAAGQDSASKADLNAKVLEALLAGAGSALLAQEPVRLDGTDALFAVATFPRDSAVEYVEWKDGKAVRTRKDSTRGLLIFAKAGFLYRLQCEVGVDFEEMWPGCRYPHKSGPDLTPEERDQAAKTGVQAIYSAMTFQ